MCIDTTSKTSIFVGANNSGKTSAMEALILFLGEKKNIITTDFTLSNWIYINNIGEKWLKHSEVKPLLEDWVPFLPTFDLWLEIPDHEIHFVSMIIPTLDWEGGKLGIRFRFEPLDLEALFQDFKSSKTDSVKLVEEAKAELELWPKTLKDFLEKDNRLNKYFKIVAYPLDPSQLNQSQNGIAKPQVLSFDIPPFDSKPLKGLIKVDIINAQRGFSDPGNSLPNLESEKRGLSHQFREYYSKHVDPSNKPEKADLDALKAKEDAQNIFSEKIKTGFQAAISEIEGIGYPGFSDPKLTISCRVDAVDSIKHSSSVQFGVFKTSEVSDLRLPEAYNGLGYQNLISMIFKLMRFRDDWMRVGKAKNPDIVENKSKFIEPLHLVLVEEPEAHLHAQVQQVFIRKAYGVLRNHENLGDKENFSTQLILSTHSSHIAHEIDFSALRYFKREYISDTEIPTASVVSLSDTFGKGDATSRFVSRYLKTTHCDLFFADGAILIEGAAERMLLPHFIKENYPRLRECYISILEIGGGHAHRLRGLIEKLGIFTLIVTDLDSTMNGSSVPADLGKSLKTNNDTLRSWVPQKELVVVML